MEATPQEIDEARTQAEIKRQLASTIPARHLAAVEKRALAEHPPVFRTTQPVPQPIRQAEAQIVSSSSSSSSFSSSKRIPKRKRHVLP